MQKMKTFKDRFVENTTVVFSTQSNAKIPLIIGTDEEGGTVVRASDNPNLRDSAYLSRCV